MTQAFVPRLRRLFGRGSFAHPSVQGDAAPAGVPVGPPRGVRPPAAPGPPSFLVDASTRTFWRPGAPSPETLVEATAASGRATVGDKVAALVAEGVRPRRGAGRGPRDPAFVELLLVELLRSHHVARAWDLLAPDCQRAWGSVDRFAAEAGGSAARLVGAEVVEVRRLAAWEDEEGRIHHDVAELDVEYAVHAGGRTRPLRRTVHWVRVAGSWRSLLYPGGRAASVV